MRNRLFAALILLGIGEPALAGQIAVKDAWFRALPASIPSAGYFTLRNSGQKPVTVTDVESPACDMLMMHKSVNGGMDHLMSLPLAPGEVVRFAPNGYHLMCMGAKPMLRPHASVPVTFALDDGTRTRVKFQVRDARGRE